jgi:hypothetical protein
MKLLNKLGIGVVVVALVGFVSFAIYEKGFERRTNDFFEAIKQKDVDATRSFLPGKGISQDYAALFSDLVPRGTVFNFKSDGMFSQWKTLVFTKDKSISGTINPEGEQKPIPVVVLFVKENNEWKIKEVKEEVKKSEPTAAEIEEKAKIMNLVRQSIADFVLSKKAKSMEHFHETISDEWKKEINVEGLNKAFAPVIADTTDWGFLNSVEPAITKYVVSKDGVLTVIGVYPSKPKRLIFEQNYVKDIENGEWKLIGFKLYTADPEAVKPTDGAQTSDKKTSNDKK